MQELRNLMNQHDPERWRAMRYNLRMERYRAGAREKMGFDPLDPPEGIEFTVSREGEEYSDLSYLGEFTDRWVPCAISHLRRQGDRRSCEFWVPAYTPEERRADMQSGGWSKGLAEYHAQKDTFRDYYRHADYGNGWAMVGVVVTLSIDGREVDTLSLWGIESDSGDYFDEVETDLKYELCSTMDLHLEAQQRIDEKTKVVMAKIDELISKKRELA